MYAHTVVITVSGVRGAVTASLTDPDGWFSDDMPLAEGHGDTPDNAMRDLMNKVTFDELLPEPAHAEMSEVPTTIEKKGEARP